MKRALFLDRDGVMNHVVDQGGIASGPRSFDQVVIYEEMDRLTEVKALGFELVLITNQPDIERGLLDPQFTEEFHTQLISRFALDAVYICPFSSNDHPLKKPNPGMFLLAEKERAIDLSRSFHLGDTHKDVGAARAAGVQVILWSRSYNRDVDSDHRVTSFDELLAILGSRDTGAGS